ncbi:LysR family transcriptional regulator [Corallincola luteus]|nr:LysR family transcriptional regulator [Corallincola luteus]
MSFRLEQIQFFLAVAELGSFTAVSDKHHVPQPTVSRQIKQLEDELGLRLFDRKARHIQLTEFGRAFLDHAKRIQSAHKDAAQFAEGSRSRPSGHLEIETLPGIAMMFLGEFEHQFAADYPDISLGINTITLREGDAPLNVDLRLHLSLPKDEQLVARPVCKVARDYYATPAFIEKYGPFNHPRELIGVPCIRILFAPGKPESWFYIEDDKSFPLDVTGSITVDTGNLAVLAALNGRGVIWLAEPQVKAEVTSGKLVKVFQHDFSTIRTIYVIYRGRQYQPPKERVFIDALMSFFSSYR